jgi:CTP synthase (UTP-ammonia lyase)
MAQAIRIALIGDHDPAVKAHQAIPRALALAGAGDEAWEWIHTTTIGDDAAERLRRFDGLWCVPASPYASTRGAISAIRFARETRRAFLGTCGGFQHAMLEYAEAVWGDERAAHAELDPLAHDPVIAPLACGLVEVTGDVLVEPGSRLAAIYRGEAASEGYHCSYGLSARHAARLASGPLRVAARDRTGEVRAVELDGHPFFFATLYQPERSALAGRAHPLVQAFVSAARGT